MGKKMKILGSHIAAGFLDLVLNMKAFFFPLSFAKMKLSFPHTMANPSLQLKMTFYSCISDCFKSPVTAQHTYSVGIIFA